MSERELKQKYMDFQKALARLEEGLAEENKSALAIDGIIQRFEFTFEISWKLMKLFNEEEGITGVCLSPKTTVKQAFKREMIEDGEGWIQMIHDRNLTSHLYDENMSKKIYKTIESKHIFLFRALDEFMKANI